MLDYYTWVEDPLWREYLVGVWTISALILLVIVGRVFLVEASLTERWWRDYIIQGISALWLCIAASFMRAVSRWVELMYENSGVEPGIWSTWVVFIPAEILFVGGQILCIYTFIPKHWHRVALWVCMTLTFILPAIVVGYYQYIR